MTTRLTRWTAAGAAVLALGGIGGGVAAAATTKPAATPVAANTILSAQLMAITVKGQPSPGKHAAGAFSGTLMTNGKVSYRITFSGLSAKVIDAVLQFGTPGKASTKSMSVPVTHLSPVKGVLTLTKSEATAVRSGKAWITLQTKKDTSGAVRGRISA